MNTEQLHKDLNTLTFLADDALHKSNVYAKSKSPHNTTQARNSKKALREFVQLMKKRGFGTSAPAAADQRSLL